MRIRHSRIHIDTQYVDLGHTRAHTHAHTHTRARAHTHTHIHTQEAARSRLGLPALVRECTLPFRQGKRGKGKGSAAREARQGKGKCGKGKGSAVRKARQGKGKCGKGKGSAISGKVSAGRAWGCSHALAYASLAPRKGASSPLCSCPHGRGGGLCEHEV
jgi:hypothetical protein